MCFCVESKSSFNRLIDGLPIEVTPSFVQVHNFILHYVVRDLLSTVFATVVFCICKCLHIYSTKWQQICHYFIPLVVVHVAAVLCGVLAGCILFSLGTGHSCGVCLQYKPRLNSTWCSFNQLPSWKLSPCAASMSCDKPLPVFPSSSLAHSLFLRLGAGHHQAHHLSRRA